MPLSTRSTFPLIGFIVLVVGGGFLIGYFSTPGQWYAHLRKPSFTPPGWLFGPVWAILYAFIAVAGWRVWSVDRRSLAMMIWWLQLVLNFLWPIAFFIAHSIELAFVIIVGLLVMTMAFIFTTKDKLSAVLFVPYVAWVGFATALNGYIAGAN